MLKGMSNPLNSSGILLFLLVFVSASPTHGEVSFNREIRPILAANCWSCHGPDAATREADLRLDTEEGAREVRDGRAALVPGDPQASLLMLRIRHADPDKRMPPPKTRKQITSGEIQTLEQWIREGARWESHWAFLPPVRPALPLVKNQEWPRQEMDHFILHRIEAEELEPSPEADRETLARRVALDLTGLPPSTAQLDAYLADASGHAYEKFVEGLLDSTAFGERMAWQWLEAARYADTDGYQNDGPRDMWRWRDWVIEAYNRNLPFDTFTIEQLAGDLLPHPTLDQLVATGFNRNHRYNSEAGLVLEEFLLENAVDRVDTTGTVWMGLTLGCARCHSHKYDPLSQEEYYQILAYFGNVSESGRAIKFGNSEPWIHAPTSEQTRKLKVLRERETEAAQAWYKLAQNGKLPTQTSEVIATLSEAAFLTNGLAHYWNLNQLPDQKIIEPGRGTPVQVETPLDQGLKFSGSEGLNFGKVGDFLCNKRFSLAFWLQVPAGSNGAVISQETTDTTRKGLLVEMVEGRLRFHIISRWIAGLATLETLEPLPVGEWIHVTLTNDGTQRARGMAIHLNGNSVDTRELHNTNSNRAEKPYGGELRLGASPHVKGFTGALDEVRIYHRSLWQDEILALSAASPVKKLAALKSVPVSAAIKEKWLRIHAGLSSEAGALLAAHDQARQERQVFEDGLPTTMVMDELDPPRPTHLRVRGEYSRLGRQVQAGVPVIFPSLPPEVPNNRLGFARWLVSGQHPLTARVTVNRYWQMLFGQGLVSTPEDFGAQGNAPTHPELLDWLATEFVRLDWNIKAMMKTLVTSATYRQSSNVRPELQSSDPGNQLWARMSRLRLPANVLRDQALLVSGLLVDQVGGPSVKPYQPANLWREASNFSYKADKGESLYRRSLYTYWKRTLSPPAMAVLDAADRESCSVRVKRTNTPLQALTLLNETGFVEAARKMGEAMAAETGAPLSTLVSSAFRRVTARWPSSRELEQLEAALNRYLEYYREHPAEAKGWFRVGESSVTQGTDPVRGAAFAALANVLLNLDETTTRE